jgi:hypothetical protein
MAAFLFCSCASVSRIIRASRAGKLGWRHADQGHRLPRLRTPVLMPWLQRALLALRKAQPQRSRGGRTRWSGATRAEPRKLTHGVAVSAETRRRWRHERGWGWRRAHLVATDAAPQRTDRCGRLRFHHAHLGKRDRWVCADARAIPLRPNVGAPWMPPGSRHAVRTPGPNETHSLAGALETSTGQRHDPLGARKNHGLCRALWARREPTAPASRLARMYVGVDNYIMHTAKAVNQGRETPPRFALLWVPTYWPKAHPIARACGEVHDKCPRHHQRKRLRDLVKAVEHPWPAKGPWKYKISRLYDDAEVIAEVDRLVAQRRPRVAA